MDLLQAHDKHRAVVLGEDRRLDLDHVVGPDREEEAVERGVVQLAQRDTVAYYRLAFRVAVWRDVGRVEQLLMPQAAECASVLVRAQDPLAEAVPDGAAGAQSESRTRGAPPPRRRRPGGPRPRSSRDVVYLDGEPQSGRIVVDNERGVPGDVCPRLERVEIDEGDALRPGSPQTDVVFVSWVRASVRVREPPGPLVERVVVRSADDRRDRKRQLADCGLPDTRWPTSGIRLPSSENDSREARDSASPCSWRCSVSQSNTARLISMSREPITPPA